MAKGNKRFKFFILLLTVAVSWGLGNVNLAEAAAPVFTENTLPCDGDADCELTVNQDENVRYDVQATDIDGDALTITATNVPAWSTFDQVSGSNIAVWQGTPDNDDVKGNPERNMKFTVSDGNGGVTHFSFKLILNDINDAPEFVEFDATNYPDFPQPSESVNQGEVIVFELAANDIDGDTLYYSLGDCDKSGGGACPEWLDFDKDGSGDNTDGIINPTDVAATNDDVGVYTVIIKVSDRKPSAGNPDEKFDEFTFSLTVINKNDPPEMTVFPDNDGNEPYEVIFHEDVAYPAPDTYPETKLDLKAIDIDGDALTFSFVDDPPIWLKIATTEKGTGDDDADKYISSLSTIVTGPGNGDIGTYEIKIKLSDGNADDDIIETLKITVENTNDAPVLPAIKNGTEDNVLIVNENESLSFNAKASDMDPTDDTLTYSLVCDDGNSACPDWLDITENGVIETETITDANVGEYEDIVIKVTDRPDPADNPLKDEETFTLKVINVNDTPNLEDISNREINEDQQYNPDDGNGTETIVDVEVSDDDNNIDSYTEAYYYSLICPNEANEACPAWLEIDENGKIITKDALMPENDDVGTYEITVKVEDRKFGDPDYDNRGTDTTDFILEVLNVNGNPAFKSDLTNEEIDEDTSYPSILEVEIEDEDNGDVHYFTLLCSDDGSANSYNNDCPDWLEINNEAVNTIGILRTKTAPVNDDVGTVFVQITVKDRKEGDAGYDEIVPAVGTLEVEVINVNDPPSLDNVENTDINEDQVYDAATPILDAAVEDDDDNEHWFYDLVCDPAPCPDWLDINANTGVIPDGTATPSNDDVGTYDIEVKVRDREEPDDPEVLTATEVFILTVVDKNDEPEITIPPENVAIDQDNSYIFQVVAIDPDKDKEKNKLYYSLTCDAATPQDCSSLPEWLHIDETGKITTSPNPDNDEVGVYGLTLTVSDRHIDDDDYDQMESATKDFTLTVNDTNDVPTISGLPDIIILTGDEKNVPYYFKPTVNDKDEVDNPNLTFWLTDVVKARGNQPGWMNFSEFTDGGDKKCLLTIMDTITTDDIGVYNLNIHVSDGQSTAVLPVTLNVVETLEAEEGDINGDSEVTLEDAIVALQVMAGITPTEGCCAKYNTLDKNTVTIQDVIFILGELAN